MENISSFSRPLIDKREADLGKPGPDMARLRLGSHSHTIAENPTPGHAQKRQKRGPEKVTVLTTVKEARWGVGVGAAFCRRVMLRTDARCVLIPESCQTRLVTHTQTHTHATRLSDPNHGKMRCNLIKLPHRKFSCHYKQHLRAGKSCRSIVLSWSKTRC